MINDFLLRVCTLKEIICGTNVHIYFLLTKFVPHEILTFSVQKKQFMHERSKNEPELFIF